MLLRETDPDFKSELFEKVKIDVKAACNIKFAVSIISGPFCLA